MDEPPATPKPADEVTTDSPGAGSVSEPYREAIEQGLRHLPALPTDLHEHIVLAGIFGGHA